MPAHVHFEPSGKQVSAPAGERLLDVVDEIPGTGISVACRAAHCGVCRISVELGAELLRPARASERETLERLGAARSERLACQIVIAGPGEIRLRRG